MNGKLTNEAALIFAAGDYLRARRSPVTPTKIERYVRAHAAQQGTLYPGATPAEIGIAVNALIQQATNAQPEEHQMSTQKQERQYAVPTPYFEKADNHRVDELLAAPARSERPETADDATALEAERAQLVAAAPDLDSGERQKAEDRILALEDVLRRWRKLDQTRRREPEQVRGREQSRGRVA
jgi:hypothetical protein